MPEGPIRILRIIARLNVGGPARHVVWLTAGLQKPGYETLLIAGSVPSGEDDMGYFAEESGVAPLYLTEMSREISPKDVLSVWKLFLLFLRERPDIVHTHTAKAGTVGRLAGLLYRWCTPGLFIGQPRKCKFVHTYHGHIFHSYYGPLKTRFFIMIERLLARLVSDRLVVISEQQRDEIGNKFRVGKAEQFKVIPLGLDLNVFAGSTDRRNMFRREFAIEDDVILVGIVGRLTDIKNHQLFLKTVARFKRISTLPPTSVVRFVMIGDGSMRPSLEKLIHSLGLEADVILAGNRKDPESFYPALDVVALTSRNEGTPLTLIEAMANGRPVIATKVGGVVDLLGEPLEESLSYQVCERGVSVPPDNEEAFAAGLIRLVDDVVLRRALGMRGQKFVETNYRKERLLEDIKDLYAELLRCEAAAVNAESAKRRLESRI